MPGSSHRFCAWHLWNNFTKKFSGGELKKLFWKASNIANCNEFRHVMVEMRSINEQAHDYLMNIDVKHRSRSKFDHTPKVNMNNNNHTESFNGWLDGIQHKPPIQLLERLREQHTQLIYTSHVTTERYTGKLPSRVKKVISDASTKSRRCIVCRCGEYEFQVKYDQYKGTLKLDEKYFDCELWQLSGIPCVHAMACINTVRADMVNYVDPYFSIERWKKCYAGVIHPILSMNLWPPFENSDLQPPTARPKKNRCRLAKGEPRPRTQVQSTTKWCGHCQEFRHNHSTCTQAAPVLAVPRRPPGRPRKCPRIENSSQQDVGHGRGSHVLWGGSSRRGRGDSTTASNSALVEEHVLTQPHDLFGTQ